MIPAHAPKLEGIFETVRDADKARVILQHMFHVRQLMKDNENFAGGLDRHDRWCPLLASNLKQLVRDYSRIINILVDNDVIEYQVNEEGGKSYFPSRYSMIYRPKFPDHMLLPEATRYRKEVILTPGVIRSVGRYYEQRYKKQVAQLLRSTSWYKPCLQFMDRLYIDVTTDEIHQLGMDKPDITSYQAELFNSGLFRFVTRDEYGHRIHSHITNLSKKLRPFLCLKDSDEPLVLVDIKCAQPYIISALFYHPGLIELVPEFRPVASVFSQYKTSPNIRLFFEECRQGILYNDLMSVTGLDKNELKKLLFGHVFYASNFRYLDDEELGGTRLNARNIFSTKYRQVLRNLDSLKKTKASTLPFVANATKKLGKDGRMYGKMYATPNMMAQRLETAIILERITRSCVNSGIENCTIHDAWILKQKDLEDFKRVFHEEFGRLGIDPPTLDVELLNRASIV